MAIYTVTLNTHTYTYIHSLGHYVVNYIPSTAYAFMKENVKVVSNDTTFSTLLAMFTVRTSEFKFANKFETVR